MGMRFRKSIKVAPGLRLNLSKSGVSASAGVRGASLTFGKNGTYANVGVPGTGVYAREKISSTKPRSNRSRAQSLPIEGHAKVELNDDGTLNVLYDGSPAEDALRRKIIKQYKPKIIQELNSYCDETNGKIEEVENIHLFTPSPDDVPKYVYEPNSVPQPTTPQLKKIGWLDNLFNFLKAKKEKYNENLETQYAAAKSEWDKKNFEHEEKEQQKKKFIEEMLYTDTDAMEEMLSVAIDSISWPRETTASFEITCNGQRAAIDIDFPEIEDMPSQTASVPKSANKVSIKQLSDSKLRQLYARHIHGVVFRLSGATFAYLPALQTVTISGFSQRLNKATGKVSDEYLLSAIIHREAWRGIDFSNLENVEPVEALDEFELIRKMTKTGVFKPITPHGTL